MANYKILVVDDEEDLCEILKFNLEVEGYDVDTANSAEEALQMNLTDYNLLLLDVMMGEMNGFKMASLLRKNEKLKHIPIIFLTAKDTEDVSNSFLVNGSSVLSMNARFFTESMYNFSNCKIAGSSLSTIRLSTALTLAITSRIENGFDI